MFANFSIFPLAFFFPPVASLFFGLSDCTCSCRDFRFIFSLTTPPWTPPTYASNKKRRWLLGNGANVDSCLRMIAVSVSVTRYWKLLNYFLSAAIELSAAHAALHPRNRSGSKSRARIKPRWPCAGMKNGYFRFVVGSENFI